MPDYEPTSRRPIADAFRRSARGVVEGCVARQVHPDVISYASIVASAAAAVCFWRSGVWPWLLVPAAGFCYLRLWLNMLDGMVALASGQASLRGELLNDLPDRVSDVQIFAGVAHSGWCHAALGYWAAIFALLTAYVGTFGQALGVGRQFGGVMSKPWRMVTLHVGAWTAWFLATRGPSAAPAQGITAMDWTLLVIVAGCVQTIIVRLRRILAGLAARQAEPLP